MDSKKENLINVKNNAQKNCRSHFCNNNLLKIQTVSRLVFFIRPSLYKLYGRNTPVRLLNSGQFSPEWKHWLKRNQCLTENVCLQNVKSLCLTENRHVKTPLISHEFKIPCTSKQWFWLQLWLDFCLHEKFSRIPERLLMFFWEHEIKFAVFWRVLWTRLFKPCHRLQCSS